MGLQRALMEIPLLGVVLLSGSLLAPFAAGSNDWAMYRGNAAHTGSEGTSPGGTGKLVWSYDTQRESETIEVAVSGDLVFMPAWDPCRDVYEGKCDKVGSYLYALRLSDGNRVWKHGIDPVDGSAIVVNDLVIVQDFRGNVVALDSKTGSEAWRIDSRSTWRPVSRGVAAGFTNLYVADNDGPNTTIRAYDLAHRNILWRAQLTGLLYSAIVPVQVGAGASLKKLVLVAPYQEDGHGYVYALDALSGSEVWKSAGLEAVS